MKKYEVKQVVIKKFNKKFGWYYVNISQSYADLGFKKPPKWGLVPAKIQVGSTVWEKSLLPLGNGTLFIALSAKVRKKEDLHEGAIIDVTFWV